MGAKSGGGMWHTAMCCHGGRGVPKLLYINPTCGPIKQQKGGTQAHSMWERRQTKFTERHTCAAAAIGECSIPPIMATQ